jgi:hypothetical protein
VGDSDVSSELGISELYSLREYVFGSVAVSGLLFQEGEVLGNGLCVSFCSKFGHLDVVGKKSLVCGYP